MKTTNNISNTDIWKMSLPLIISRIPELSFFMVAVLFLGNSSAAGLEAIANAVVFFLIPEAFTDGWVVSTVQNRLSFLLGSKKTKDIIQTLHHSLFIAFLLSILTFFVVFFIAPLFIKLTISSFEIRGLMLSYIDYRSFGIPFIFVNYVLISFLLSHKNTKLIPIITLLQLVTNICLNYFLVNGNQDLGIAAMGIKGTAISTVVSELVGMIGYSLIIWRNYKNEYSLFSFQALNKNIIEDLLKFNYALRSTISMFFWYIFYAIITSTGETNAAISGVTKSIFTVLALSVSPFKSVTITFIGYEMGSGGDKSKIQSIIIKNMILCFVSMCVISATTILFANEITDLFLAENKKHLAPYIVQCIYTLGFTLPFISPFSHMIAASLNAFNKHVLLRNTEIISSLLYVSVAYLLATVFEQPIHVIWLAEPIYAAFNLMLLLPFLLKAFKKNTYHTVY